MHVVLEKPETFMALFRFMATMVAPLLKYDPEIGLPVFIRTSDAGLRIHTHGSGLNFTARYKDVKVIEKGEIVINHGLFHKIPLTNAIQLKATKNDLKFVSGSASGSLHITQLDLNEEVASKSGIDMNSVSSLDLRLLLNSVLFRKPPTEPTTVRIVADKNRLTATTNDAFKAACSDVPMKCKKRWSVDIPRMFAESLARGLTGTEGLIQIGADPMRVVVKAKSFDLTVPTLQTPMPIVDVRDFIDKRLNEKSNDRVRAMFDHEEMLKGAKDATAVFRNTKEDRILGVEFIRKRPNAKKTDKYKGAIRLIASTDLGVMRVVIKADVTRQRTDLDRVYVSVDHLQEFLGMASDKSANATAKKAGVDNKFNDVKGNPQKSRIIVDSASVIMQTPRFSGFFQTKRLS